MLYVSHVCPSIGEPARGPSSSLTCCFLGKSASQRRRQKSSPSKLVGYDRLVQIRSTPLRRFSAKSWRLSSERCREYTAWPSRSAPKRRALGALTRPICVGSTSFAATPRYLPKNLALIAQCFFLTKISANRPSGFEFNAILFRSA
jgi:hypothetical protein